MLALDAVVAIGVSGGKDSQALAIAVHRHLEAIGHKGPRILIHSDLGVVEWKDSLPVCERLAAHLGYELVTVRRASGDMLDRWRSRWEANIARFADLTCVKLILPWSTPSWRFCTSELKSQVCASALKKRFPGRDILNVMGVRREESSARAKLPVSQANTLLRRKDAAGLTWNAILEWRLQDVLGTIERAGLALHEAYTVYHSSRVSCAYCIMSSEADMKASASCEGNQQVFRDMVDLELVSTYAFQGGRWLADMAPHLLTAEQRARLPIAKELALMRKAAEARLPAHLLFTKGFPTVLPNFSEAQLIADVRREVARLVGLSIGFTEPDAVLARYSELLERQRAANDEEDEEEAVVQRISQRGG